LQRSESTYDPNPRSFLREWNHDGCPSRRLKGVTPKLVNAANIAPEGESTEKRRPDGILLHHANERINRLVAAVQELSLARNLETVMAIVRRAARELTQADGATFVLRDEDFCHYADEDAIAPLWKGQRFPVNICISGWAMIHRCPAVVEDIYADPRVPADAYRPTFVKSLAMVPIRTAAPIGAIGIYWATRHVPTEAEVELLQALANTTSVAMENVSVYSELEQRVQDRTAELKVANHELEAFAHTVSHDLRAPLRAIFGFSTFLRREFAEGSAEANDLCERIQQSVERMDGLIGSLLNFSNVTRLTLSKEKVRTDAVVAEVLRELDAAQRASVHVEPLPDCVADAALLKQVFVNLLSNALKFSGRKAEPRVEVSATVKNGEVVYCVRDNGAGFDMAEADKLFGVFQRLHSAGEFEGVGVGLSIVQRIVQRHGGRVWAEGVPGQGAAFYFTLAPH
jgi:hypothetical protein